MKLNLSGWFLTDAISSDQVSSWYPKEISGIHQACTQKRELNE